VPSTRNVTRPQASPSSSHNLTSSGPSHYGSSTITPHHGGNGNGGVAGSPNSLAVGGGVPSFLGSSGRSGSFAGSNATSSLAEQSRQIAGGSESVDSDPFSSTTNATTSSNRRKDSTPICATSKEAAGERHKTASMSLKRNVSVENYTPSMNSTASQPQIRGLAEGDAKTVRPQVTGP